MNVDYSAIGQRIKAHRKTQKMTQEHLAEGLSVSVGYVSQLERGVTKISLETLSAIATLLACDLAELVAGVAVAQDSYLDRELSMQTQRMDARQKRMLLDMAKVLLKY